MKWTLFFKFKIVLICTIKKLVTWRMWGYNLTLKVSLKTQVKITILCICIGQTSLTDKMVDSCLFYQFCALIGWFYPFVKIWCRVNCWFFELLLGVKGGRRDDWLPRIHFITSGSLIHSLIIVYTSPCENM